MSINTGADNTEAGKRGGWVLEARYIMPFIVGAKHVFKTMFDIELIDKTPFVKNTTRSNADVTGVMGFTGDKRGTMAFSMSTEGALTVYGRLMDEELGSLSPEVADAMGELTNIISGQARKELEKESLHLLAHVPLIFIGKNVEVSLVTKGIIMTIPFTFTVNGKTEEMSIDCVFE
jgi:chemotaxis protein CheX